jgi:hypothetical protein
VSSVCNACQMAKSHQLPYNHSIHRSTMQLELIHSDVWILLQFLLVVINIISVLLMTLQNLHGFILWLIEVIFSIFFSNFKHMLSASLTPKSNMFSPIGVGNINTCITNFLPHFVLVILFPAHTHTNKMARSNENTVTLSKRVLRY